MRVSCKKVVYIRSTDLIHWRDHIHPLVLKRLKANGSKYNLLGYALNFDACDQLQTPAIVKADPFDGELAYSMSGVFFADHPLRHTGARNGQVEIVVDSVTVGILDRVEVEPRFAADEWLKQLVHPWIYQKHTTFNDYITDFRPAVGRSWCRVNSASCKENP